MWVGQLTAVRAGGFLAYVHGVYEDVETCGRESP